ncbi:MAG: hypothetical protein SFW66_10140 [Gammaproteobacteria bacterium]|nr:hypothetical protein [Gammaproteobacteria bacterium]
MLPRESKIETLELNHDRFFNHPVSFISKRGFLPGKDPLEQLPEASPFNQKLNEIAKNIPVLIESCTLRSTVDALNDEFKDEEMVLIPHGTQMKKQQHVAIMTLLMIAQAYIWEDEKNPMNVLPAVIAKNLYKLCRSQQRMPTLTYKDYILRNWRLLDPEKEISLDNIEPIYTFTNSADEAWFIKIHVVIESICSKAIIAACKAYGLAHDLIKDPSEDPLVNQETERNITELLNVISTTLEEAILVLKRMTEQCRHEYFFFTLRHYLGGWEKVIKKDGDGKEHVGIFFEGVETKDKNFHSYRGPSGAESSIIPALDAFLSVEQEIDGMYKTLLNFQEYMPRKHQAFVGYLSTSKVREVVETSDSVELKEAFENATRHVKAFRGTHLGIVHQYIMVPAKTIGIKSDEITGTGGAPIGEYLVERYQNTLHH